ncbi:MAG: hypothetical protein HY280_01350 [Nitrospinae bacterium]|nr:hypothetical protein [Nitrospinota bacterium]
MAINWNLVPPFKERLDAEGKSAEEIVNKLVALYLDGKIVLEPSAP